MSLQVNLAFTGDLAGYALATHLRLARGARNAVEKQSARAKLALRGDTRPQLGERVANAWRADIYPKSASVHTHAPAVQVYTNAPKIITAFSQATTIRAKNGAYLAIPTENVPLRRGHRHATPNEVKALFGIENFTVFEGRAGQLLLFVPAVRAKSGKGFRKATSIRTGVQGRKAELILMFVLVRQVGLQKKLNTEKIFADLSVGWEELFPAEIAAALSAGD